MDQRTQYLVEALWRVVLVTGSAPTPDGAEEKVWSIVNTFVEKFGLEMINDRLCSDRGTERCFGKLPDDRHLHVLFRTDDAGTCVAYVDFVEVV